jgi:tetratricopeptide (TPR) repeat protein
MAVFAGGCTIDAVEAVCPDDKLPQHAIFETVTSLVDRSLLTTEERLGSMRYGMLESIRHYASLRLDEAGERAEMSPRHLGWLLDLARQADVDGPDQGAWLDLLAADHDNFVSGLEWSLSASAESQPAGPVARSALALAGALAPFWKVRGYTSLGQRWLDAALAAAGPGADPRLRAVALDGAGQLAAVRADYDAQRGYQEESLAIWRSLGEDARIASSLGDLGSAAHTRADYPAAQAMHQEALCLARVAGEALQMARSLSGLGVLALHQGNLARAAAYFEEGMQRFGEVGDLRRATLILGNLAVVAINHGDFELARTRLEEHLGNARRLGDRKLMAGALTNLGMAVHHLGDLDRAEQLHQEALELTEQIGDRRISAVTLTNLGLVAYARKDFAAAVFFHLRSLALAEAVGEPRSIAESLEELAQAQSALGDMHHAARLFGAAQAIREAIGAPIPDSDVARCNDALAATEMALGSEQFALARDAGRALSVAEAVEFAKGTSPSPAGSAHKGRTQVQFE